MNLSNQWSTLIDAAAKRNQTIYLAYKIWMDNKSDPAVAKSLGGARASELAEQYGISRARVYIILETERKKEDAKPTRKRSKS